MPRYSLRGRCNGEKNASPALENRVYFATATMISLPHRLSATYSTSDSLSLLATSVDSQPEQRYDGIHSVLSTRVPNFEFRIATATACCSTCGYLWEAVFLPRLWHSALPWQSPRLRSLSHRWSPPTESRKGRLPMTEYNKARRLQRMYSFEKGQQVRVSLGHYDPDVAFI